MPLEHARERLVDVWDEAQPLLMEHWQEIAHYKDIPLEPRVDIYRKLDEAGVVRTFTARDEGRLVGYAAYVIDQHMHYASFKRAAQDVLFLLPGYRNAGNGAALIAYTEGHLKEEGVQCVTQHVKFALDFSPLLECMGYEPMEKLYVKRLDH